MSIWYHPLLDRIGLFDHINNMEFIPVDWVSEAKWYVGRDPNMYGWVYIEMWD